MMTMAPFRQTTIAVLITTVFAQASAQTVAPAQLPTGGKVVAGQAVIQQSGSALNINQATQRAAIDWNTFNVGKDAQVNFNQPSASAVTLNRVLDTNASQIMGRINATGQVFLVNPNGVLFGPNSQVDVGGLVATTQNISNADFMAGKSTFEGDGRSGVAVVNQGQLNAVLGGYIALLAPTVRNEGVVVAREGSVALAAGDKSVIEFSGTRMTSVLVDRAVMDALVDNRQVVRADGGWVLLSARSANAILSSVITNSGAVQANTVVNKNGRIVLEGGDQGVVSVSGSLQAAGVDAGTQGGSVVVTGDKVQIASGAQLDASGKAGGGNVLVGGGWQGQDPSIRQANAVVVESGTRLDASATDQGNGGTVVVWSNTQKQDSVTRVSGELLARGGANGGDGGKIETSGHWLSTEGVKGDASAAKGKGGEWLFDPYDVTISSATTTASHPSTSAWTSSGSATSYVSNADIVSMLNQGTNVTVSTGNSGSSTDGNITVASPISATPTGGNGAAKLTLTANHNIAVSNTISVAGSGSMVELNAGNATGGGGVSIGAAVNVDTLSLNITGAGTVTQSAAVTANNLKLTGTNTDVTLNQSSNKVGTIAANVKSLSLVNDTGVDLNSSYGTGLYVGTVDGLSGINATGRVSITMNNGNIFLDKNIATTATDTSWTAPALMLNAGANLSPTSTASAGVNPYGPNIVRLGTATLTVGSGGRGMLYTGSVDGGSAALATYIGAGTGRFRYGNDESTLSAALTAGLTPLLSGMNVIYRQQPLLSVASSTTQTYGLTTTIAPTFSGYANGDTLSTSVANSTGLTIAIAGPTSTAGYYTAGDHALTVSGAQSNLGYGFSYLPSNLTVNKKGLTVTASASTKTYDGLTAATTQLSSDKFALDDVVVTSTSSRFSDKNAAAGKTVTVSGLALSSGVDAGNYIILNSGATATTTGTITAKSITGVYTAQDKTYDGTTTATVTGTSTGVLAGDTVTFVNGVATFANKNANAAGTSVTLTSIGLGGADGTNYSIANPTSSSLSAVISPKTITASFTATSKIYDGTTTASVTGSTAPFLGGDTPTYTGVVANFDDKNAGTGKNVNISGYSLTGSGATNYVLQNSTATATADINKKSATMSGVTASGKTYDGTTSATLSGGSVSGLVTINGQQDDVVLTTVGTFSDKNVAATKTVNIAASYSGADAGNYSFTNQATTTAGITARSLAVTAIGQNKEYDGTATATYSLVSNQIAGDALTIQASSGVFNDVGGVANTGKNAGVGKTVSVGGITVTGADATNYTQQNTTTTTTATITPKGLTATVSASDKVYDSTTSATATLSNVRGLVGSETVTISGNSATFNSADVATASTVTVNSIQLGDGTNGGLASNYTIAAGQSASARITPKTLTATATASNKTYDGSTSATAALTFSGMIGSQTVGNTNSASFNSKDVLTANTVTVNTIALTDGSNGGKATNYSVSAGQTASANITAKTLTGTATADNKVYDGNDTATARLALSGLVGGETLGTTYNATFNSKNVTAANTVTLSNVQLANGTNGGLASNYSLASGQTATAHITPKALTMTANAQDKVYDGDTTATVSLTNVTGLVGNETLGIANTASFNSKDVLGASAVTVNNINLSNGSNGGLASNYSAAAGQTATAHITPLALSASLTANNKTYDSTTAATGSLNVSGLIGAETLVVTHRESFADKNAGTGKVVTVDSVQLADGANGGKASNYTLQAGQTSNANVAAKTISVQYQGVSKNFDGTNAATVVGSSTGVYRGDDVVFTNNPTVYADSLPSMSKPILVSGIAMSGADAGNYSLGGQTSTTAYGSITLPTGCTGNCSQPMAAAPVTPPVLASASASNLVSGVNAGAIKRTTDTNFQVPATAKPVAPAAVLPATPLDSATANLSVNNASQVRSLSADQVSALPPAKLAELMPVLTPKQLMAVTPDQMAGLDATQLNQLVNLMDNALSKMKR
jgi:filamentous hemagglutinin family protein